MDGIALASGITVEKDVELKQRIQAIYDRHKGTYGYRRIQAQVQ
ncbi:IS3 family transposase [Paenibacillus gorillae]